MCAGLAVPASLLCSSPGKQHIRNALIFWRKNGIAPIWSSWPWVMIIPLTLCLFFQNIGKIRDHKIYLVFHHWGMIYTINDEHLIVMLNNKHVPPMAWSPPTGIIRIFFSFISLCVQASVISFCIWKFSYYCKGGWYCWAMIICAMRILFSMVNGLSPRLNNN